jgi:hypothetical protein
MYREGTGLGMLQATLGANTGAEPISTGAGGDGDQCS